MTLANTISPALARLREQIRTTSPDLGHVEWVGAPLRLGAVHEWFGLSGSRGWMPPLCILTDVARRALTQRAIVRIFWIGRRVWPYPLLMDRHSEVLERSILIDPPDDASRLWATDVALRTAAPVAVIADGERLTLSHTRRLQLAASHPNGGALCLLARPVHEFDALSAATTRWNVTPERSMTVRPRWNVALLRNKDRPVLAEEPPSWTVEWNHAQHLVCVASAVADRTGRAAAQAS